MARAYVQQLRDLVLALGVSDARMDQGSLRCDVNLSLRPRASRRGDPVETKNVNSFRSVERAARYEIGRHAAILDAGRRGRAGDAALPRGHRNHVAGPGEVRRRRLPVLPRARLAPSLPPGSGSSRCADAARTPAERRLAGCRRTGASPTWRCGTPWVPGHSSWWPPRSPPRALRRRPPASGGSPSWPAGRTSRGVEVGACRSPRAGAPHPGAVDVRRL